MTAPDQSPTSSDSLPDPSALPGTPGRRVAIEYLTAGRSVLEFNESLLRLLVHDLNHNRYVAGIFGRRASGNLAVHRNEAVEHFLSTPFDWMLFLDDDIEFEADTLDKLMSVASVEHHPVVCGLYMNAGLTGGIVPMMYRIDPETNRTVEWSLEQLDAVMAAGITHVPVDSSGAGCLLVHRKVYEDLLWAHGAPMPWFVNSIEPANDPDGTVRMVVQGEDHGFFRRLHAAGIPVLMDLSVNLHHHKTNALHKGMVAQALHLESLLKEKP